MLFIVGDLYDYWFDDKYIDQKGYYRTLTELKELSDKGVVGHYFIGNHDFLHLNVLADEIGTMGVTEQIDGLESMRLNSTGYLCVPRIVAGILMFPCLYLGAGFVGIGGGAGVGHLMGVISVSEFMEGARLFFNPFDPVFGVIKSVVFGFTITSISCFVGYRTVGGAEGVGRSTTQAAVYSCVFLLVADLVLAITLL